MIGLIILCFLVLVSLFADLIADYEETVIKQDIPHRLEAPGKNHWFGTDEYGRDVFARIVHGTRVSLYVGALSVLIGVLAGGTLGALAGYCGGFVDGLIMRLLDVLMALPVMLLTMAIIAAFGSSMINLMLAIGISNIPKFARVLRASVISLKRRGYVEAAQILGLSQGKIILRHILPHCLGPLLVQMTLRVAYAILAISALSYLGIGVKPPSPEWGAMLAGGRSFIRTNAYLSLFPGMAIMLTIVGLNLLGDGLRDALDIQATDLPYKKET
jgi:peptide/nickel transport system permease protein